MKLQYFIIFYQPNFPQGNRTLVADKLKMLYIYIYIYIYHTVLFILALLTNVL